MNIGFIFVDTEYCSSSLSLPHLFLSLWWTKTKVALGEGIKCFIFICFVGFFPLMSLIHAVTSCIPTDIRGAVWMSSSWQENLTRKSLTRRRSCKQWLSLAKPWKCPYGRFHSPWATNSLFREVYWSPASASQALDGGWCPSVHYLPLLRRIWLPNYYSYPSGSCRLLLNHLSVIIPSLYKLSSFILP